MAELKIPSPGGELSAYLATPSAQGPWPGIVVVHAALGMSRTSATRPTGWRAKVTWPWHLTSSIGRDDHLPALDQRATCAPGGDGPSTTWRPCAPGWPARMAAPAPLGVIGFCIGGGFAMMLAPGHGFSASSVNYGVGFRRMPTRRRLGGCLSIVGSYGAKDRANRGTAQKLDRVLQALGVDHDVKEYPDAGTRVPQRPRKRRRSLPSILAVMGLFSGASDYHETSAQDARHRILSFFNTHLT